MANKHLSEDEIKYVISADSSKAQQELHLLGKSTAALRREEKARRSAMIELEATGKKNSTQYKKLREECKEYSRQIADNDEKMKKLRQSLDVNSMTMNQLRKYSKELSSELNNTSKAASPKQYAELESRLQGVTARMEELKISAKSYKEIMTNQSSINYLAGNMLTKGAELVGTLSRKFIESISEAIGKCVELAESADGIVHAFERIGTQDYLQTLRDATKGTVSDVELMKAAVKAKDFRIPLEDLGKYLSFAQLKAQQTGESLEYMVDSIVTGLGRKSPQILDNLGLSASEIKEQTKKTGDFMKAVAGIVENNLAKAGETYISATDRAAQRTVELENAQRSLGESLLPIKEDFSNIYGQIQIGVIKTIKYLVQHRDTLITLSKAVGLLVITYAAYVAGQKLAYLWSLRAVAVSKLKAAAVAVENTMIQLSALRHAVLNNTMKISIALQQAFNTVLKLSPWGLVLGSITLVVGALLMFNKRTDAATIAQKKLNSIHDEANRKVEEERIKIEMLTRRIHDNNLSLTERHNAISALQKIVPDYTAKLSAEGRVYDENTVALTRYLNALKEKALIEGAQSQLKELGEQKASMILKRRQQQEELNELKREQQQFAQQNTNRAQTSGGTTVSGNVNALINYSANVSALSGEIKKTNEQIKAVDATLDVIGKEFGKNLFRTETNSDSPFTENKSKTGKTRVGDKNNSHDDIAAKNFSHNRSQDLDNAKQAYRDDVDALKKALAEKKITQEQYNAYVAALNIQHQNNLLAIEESYLQRSNSISISDAEKKKQLQEQQQKAFAEQQQAANQAYIEAEKQYYDVLEKIKAAAPDKPKSLQEECDAKLLVLEAYYKASLQMAQENGERHKEVTEAYEKAKADIVAEHAKKTEEEKERARQEYGLDTFQDKIEARRKSLDEDFAKGSLSRQQYNQAIANLEQQSEEHRLQIRQQYGLVSQQEVYDAELQQLKMHLQNKELSEEEYEEAVKNMKVEKYKEAFDRYSNLVGSAVSALQDAEISNVEAKYDAEIEAAKNAGRDTTDLEKKKANEKLKIQKKYADVNFAIKASQIIADTSVAIMKALAELGPVAGPVAAALMGVTGAAQLAAANAERQKVKKMSLNGGAGGASSSAAGERVAVGLESGGNIDVRREQDGKMFHAAYEPKKRGFVDKPTVIVGEGGYGQSREWVASNAAVNNPTVAPLIDIIDRAQRAGTIRTLDMNKWMATRIIGRAEGGTITQNNNLNNASLPYPAPTRDSDIDKQLLMLLKQLSTEGVPAHVVLSEIEEKQQLRNRARNIARK